METAKERELASQPTLECTLQSIRKREREVDRGDNIQSESWMRDLLKEKNSREQLELYIRKYDEEVGPIYQWVVQEPRWDCGSRLFYYIASLFIFMSRSYINIKQNKKNNNNNKEKIKIKTKTFFYSISLGVVSNIPFQTIKKTILQLFFIIFFFSILFGSLLLLFVSSLILAFPFLSDMTRSLSLFTPAIFRQCAYTYVCVSLLSLSLSL